MNIVLIDFFEMNEREKCEEKNKKRDASWYTPEEVLFLHKKRKYGILDVYYFRLHVDTMAFHPKVKNFTQNTFFFSLGLVIMMLFYEIGYSRYESLANTQENETQANTLGSTVTALGMNIGLQKHIAETTPVNLLDSTIEVTPTLSDPQIGEKSFLTENMKFLEAYTELLSTDIPSLLDQATDRTTAIDAYRNLLLEYQTL